MDRPTIYFDQNLLCDPIEAIINSDKYEIWRDTVYIAYSDETILEIIRSVGLEDRILRNLEKFTTVRVCRELINFKQTNRFLCGLESPRQRFEELRSDPFFMSPNLSGLASLHKSFGGQKDKSYQNILDDQMVALRQTLSSTLRDTGMTQSEIDKIVGLLPNSLGVLDESSLEQSMEGGASSSPALEFRRELGLDLQELNKIIANKVIEQIWRLIQASPTKLRYADIDAFFQIKGLNPITHDPYTTPDKVRNMMLMLNMIGYFPDKKLRKERQFKSSASDLGHASWGSLCSAFITRDINFRQRLMATYEYLGVGTSIYGIEYSDGFELIDFWAAH